MSKNIHITIAAGDMDRVAAIKDGRVQVEGCDVTFIPMEPEEVFFPRSGMPSSIAASFRFPAICGSRRRTRQTMSASPHS